MRESHYSFAIKCQFNERHFELFHGIFLLFHIHMELFSVMSTRSFIHLALLRPLITIWPRNWYQVPAMKPLSTAIFNCVYTRGFDQFGFLYGIDNYTMMILSFVLDRTISGHRPLLDIAFGQLLCHPGRLADTYQSPLDPRRFGPAIARCLIVCLEPLCIYIYIYICVHIHTYLSI